MFQLGLVTSDLSQPITSTLIMSHKPEAFANFAIRTASSAVFAPAVFGSNLYLVRSNCSRKLG